MKYNDPFYWDWEDSIFKDYIPQNTSRKLEDLAKQYDVRFVPTTKMEEFPLGEIFFNVERHNDSSAIGIHAVKYRKGSDYLVGESDHFEVDFNEFSGMGPIRKNGQIWDTNQIRSELEFLDYIDGPADPRDEFYDALAYCFGLTTKSSNEKPVLNDRPYHKGYPE